MTLALTAPERVILLHRAFPCCGGRSRFLVEADTYDRTCRTCGQGWTVRRTTRAASPFAIRLGARFDVLEWERTGEPSYAVVTRRGRIGTATKSGAPATRAAQTAKRAPGQVDWFGADSVESSPTSLYRYYDRHDVLLYVGITGRGTTRNIEHVDSAEWWPFVARQEVEHFPSRPLALVAERSLIRSHRPPFNKQGNLDAAAMKDVYLAFAAKSYADEPAAQQYARLGKRLCLSVFRDAGGLTTFATNPADYVVANTLEMTDAPVKVIDGKGEHVGRILRIERNGIHTFLRGQVRKGVRIAEPVATLKAISMKKPVRTRIGVVRLEPVEVPTR